MKYVIAGYRTAEITRLWNKYVVERGEPHRQTTHEFMRIERKAVLKELTKEHNEALESYRGLLIERYELIIESLHPMVRNGNLGAVDRYLKTLQQLGDITGAATPIKFEVENTTHLTQEERQRRVLELLTVARQRREHESENEEYDGEYEGDDDVIDLTPDPPCLPEGNARDDD